MAKAIQYIWLTFLLLLPLVLWILPADTFNDFGVELCPSKVFFDVECFGCGITRAVMHIHHFQFTEAIYYHSFVYIIYPLLILIWLIFVKSSMQYLGIGLAKYIPVKTDADRKKKK